MCNFEVEEEMWPQHGAFIARENKYFHFVVFIPHWEPAVVWHVAAGSIFTGQFTAPSAEKWLVAPKPEPLLGSGGWWLGPAHGAWLVGQEKCILVESNTASK